MFRSLIFDYCKQLLCSSDNLSCLLAMSCMSLMFSLASYKSCRKSCQFDSTEPVILFSRLSFCGDLR